MSLEELGLQAAMRAIQIGLDVAASRRVDYKQAALELSSAAIALVPVDELKAFLEERDKLAIDAAVDVAEAVKLAEAGQ